MAHFTNCSCCFIRGCLNHGSPGCPMTAKPGLYAGTLRSLKVQTDKEQISTRKKRHARACLSFVYLGAVIWSVRGGEQPHSLAALHCLCGFCSLVGQADVYYQQLFGLPLSQV